MEQAILEFFQSIRCDALTVVFGVFSTLGEGMIVAGIVVLLYWLWDEGGEQLLFTAISSCAINSLLKTTIARPRPYAAGIVTRLDVDTPVFSTRDLGDTLSFPSGHAQSTSSALIAASAKKKKAWLWILSFVLIALVVCSRLYFGVHYPTDLLAGFLLGTAIALFWWIVFRYAYRLRFYFLMGAAIVCLAFAFFFPEKEYLEMCALLAGGAVFLPFVSLIKPTPSVTWKKRLLRVVVGGVITGAMFGLTLLFPEDLAFKFLKWFLLFGAGTLGAKLLFRALRI